MTMNKFQRQSYTCWLSVALLIALFAGGIGSIGWPPRAAAQATTTIYMPIVRLPTETIFGLNMTRVAPGRGLTDVVALRTSWVRGSSLIWRDVEPVEGGEYHWDAPSVKLLEQEMQYASQYGLKLIVVVRSSPAWATKPYRADCAPIHPTKYARFAAFLAAAAARYSKDPYDVTFWEIGNEPDAPILQGNSGFGCWGFGNDPYYGGRAYGAMLNAVYPSIKAAAPQSTVLNGGLLLDQPYNPSTGSGLSARFLEGMLLAGAGASFDMLSFHSYSYYDLTADCTRGPVDWKVGYLRTIMQTYGVPQKPLINTETALLCVTVTPECREAQADAVARYYARAINDRLAGQLWYIYDSDSFRNTALVEPSNVAVQRPAFHAYQAGAALLENARPIGALTGQPAGVEGYSFSRGRQIITIVWSDIAQPVAISVDPTASVECFDRDGQPLMCDNTNGAVSLTVQTHPIYIIQN
jgi:hypothetical protein